MAIITKVSAKGKLQKVVLASWKGIDYIRSLPKERSSDQWSTPQKNHRKCFGAVSQFAKSQMYSLIVPIWNKLEHETLSGYNQFIKANKRAFEPAGIITEPRLLKLSKGKLILPNSVKVESTTINSNILNIEISWKNNQRLDKERENDSLIVLLLINNNLSSPIKTESFRKECYANLEIDKVKRMPDCIYLFFISRNNDKYSDSLALLL